MIPLLTLLHAVLGTGLGSMLFFWKTCVHSYSCATRYQMVIEWGWWVSW